MRRKNKVTRALNRNKFLLFVVACTFLAGMGVGALVAVDGAEIISRCAYYLGPPL